MDAPDSAQGLEEITGEHHAQNRSGEVDPDRLERSGVESRAKGARGVHGHAGNRGFEGDVEGDEGSGEVGGVAVEAGMVGDGKDGEHQESGDGEFGEEGGDIAGGSGLGDDIVDSGVRQRGSEEESGEKDAGGRADEMREDVARGVVGFDFSEEEEVPGDGGVHVGAGPLAEGGKNEADRGKAHGDAGEGAAEEGIGKGGHGGGIGVMEEDAERAGRDHEEAEGGGFDEVFGPVEAGRDRGFRHSGS